MNLVVTLIALALLAFLFYRISKQSTFMLPTVYLSALLIGAIIGGSLVVSGILKLLFKRCSFLLIVGSITSIAAVAGIYKFSTSPPLTIIIPKGYTGGIYLVLSNNNEDILTVDSNGIGYISISTYNNTFSPPVVLETDSTDISSRCVGYNPTTFWGRGNSSSVSISAISKNENSPEIYYLTFEVVPKGKEGQKQYYSTALENLVDTTKLYKRK